MRVAVLNVGTGTVKAACFTVERGVPRERGRAQRERGAGAEISQACLAALDEAGAEPGAVDAVGHRVVHGGAELVRPTTVDAAVEARLEALSPLAPLHNPPALEGLRAVRELYPGCPQVAVFDTAFHAGRDEASRRYALPWELAEAAGLWRYGFHGIAHAGLAEALAAARGIPLRAVHAVTLQLGAGASACAVRAGRSVETSMGFSPLEGLVMATRSGDLDPAAVLHLLRGGRSANEVEALLTRRSGLLGLAGSADLREVLAAEARGERRAQVAVALYVRRIVATVGAYLTLLGGEGDLVFGGGVGTHSAEIRRRVVEGLAAWGASLDPQRNRSGEPGRLSPEGARGVFVFATDEERWIARAVAEHLEGEGAGG